MVACCGRTIRLMSRQSSLCFCISRCSAWSTNETSLKCFGRICQASHGLGQARNMANPKTTMAAGLEHLRLFCGPRTASKLYVRMARGKGKWAGREEFCGGAGWRTLFCVHWWSLMLLKMTSRERGRMPCSEGVPCTVYVLPAPVTP